MLASVLGMIKEGATHIAVATDHVIESFRNGLWPGYKTGEGIEPDLLAQFPLLEEVLSAAGMVVWPMVEFEADDALAAAAALAARDARVDRVIICTPDKDLAQCVRGTRVVQLNRRTRVTFDEAGVIQKFGVPPASIPDYLALVGDSADGYPGLPGWGAKSTAAVLAKYRPPGIHPRGLARMARERRPTRALSPPRSSRERERRSAIPNAGHASHRYPALRRRGATAMERAHTRLPGDRSTIGCSRHRDHTSLSAPLKSTMSTVEARWIAEARTSCFNVAGEPPINKPAIPLR